MYREFNHLAAISAVAAVVSSTVLPATTLVAAPDPAPPLSSTEQRDLVPAYFYPDFGLPVSSSNPVANEWQKMCDVAKPESIIVANHDDGDAKAADPAYQKAVLHCQMKGLKVVSYVFTSRGDKPRAELAQQVRNQMAWYKPDGIFLDEMNYDSNERLDEGGTVKTYYAAISDIIRSGPRNRDGSLKIVIGNPGDVSEKQGDWGLRPPTRWGIFPIIDVLVVFEGTASKYKTWPQPTWVYPGPRQTRARAYRFAHIVHTVREFPFSEERAITDLSRRNHAGYVYVTTESEGTQPPSNPHADSVMWNMLAPSWFRRHGSPPPVR